MSGRRVDPAFWSGRRVLLTGHTGFMGSWAALWLDAMGAEVTGLSLPPDTWPALYDIAGVEECCTSIIGDIRDWETVTRAVTDARPQIVLHMAAQALVRPSYRDPVGTLATNVMGTAHVLEAVRAVAGLEAVLVVTTDKVYENHGQGAAFAESDPLGGQDPCSASKAAAEIVTQSYRRSFLQGRVPLMTARAGTVIGGGDFARDRIVPDIWRAARKRETLVLRYPEAIQTWQHVLDCLQGYFLYIEAAVSGDDIPMALNFGPGDAAGKGVTVAELVERMQEALGVSGTWQQDTGEASREMRRLGLDSCAARTALGWEECYTTEKAVAETTAWYRAYHADDDPARLTCDQIAAFGAE